MSDTSKNLDIKYTPEETLQLISKAMENETSTSQQVKFSVHRANLYYELGDYKKALLDLKFINEKNMMTNSLKVMKWKCMIHNNIAEIRKEVRSEIANGDDETDELTDFLNFIRKDKMIEVFQSDKKQPMEECKRKNNN